MTRTSVDTNILVRLIIRDDVDQWAIADALFRGRQWFLLTTVILESEWVMRSRYSLDRTSFCDVIDDLLELESVEFEERERVTSALQAHRAGMGFADALHVAATPEDTVFATFDEALVKQARQHFSHLEIELAQ